MWSWSITVRHQKCTPRRSVTSMTCVKPSVHQSGTVLVSSSWLSTSTNFTLLRNVSSVPTGNFLFTSIGEHCDWWIWLHLFQNTLIPPQPLPHSHSFLYFLYKQNLWIVGWWFSVQKAVWLVRYIWYIKDRYTYCLQCWCELINSYRLTLSMCLQEQVQLYILFLRNFVGCSTSNWNVWKKNQV